MSSGGGASSGSTGSTGTTSATTASARSRTSMSRLPARRVLHRRVAQALELRHHDDLDPIAAQLAAQLESAGLALRACEMYERAAAVAVRVLASAEATRHLSRALAILAESPASRDRDVHELRLLLRCRGHSSRSRVTPHGARKRRPSARVHSPRTSARRSTSGSRSMGCGRCASWEERWIGQERSPRPLSGDRTDTRTSHRRVTWPWVDPSRSWASLRRPSANSSERSRHTSPACRSPRPREPIPASAPCRGDRMPCGSRVERQPPRSGRAGRSPPADSLDGPYVKMLAQSYAAILDQIDGDVDAMLKHSTVAAELCSHYGFAYYREWPLILAAWANRGVGSDSPARIERALDEMRSIRALARRPYYLSLLADAHEAAGDPRQARAVLEAALADAATSGEQWWVPELHRRLGTLDDGPSRRSGHPSRRGSRHRTGRLVAGPPRSDQPGASRTVRAGHAPRCPRTPSPSRRGATASKPKPCLPAPWVTGGDARERFANDRRASLIADVRIVEA